MKKSIDGGATFTRDDSGLHADSHALVYDVAGNIFTGNDGVTGPMLYRWDPDVTPPVLTSAQYHPNDLKPAMVLTFRPERVLLEKFTWT